MQEIKANKWSLRMGDQQQSMKVYIPFKRNNYSVVRITPFCDSILLSEAMLIGLTVPFFLFMFNTTKGQKFKCPVEWL